MMGKHEHSFRQKGNGEVVPTPAPAGHALIVLVRQVEPGSRLRAAFYLNADLRRRLTTKASPKRCSMWLCGARRCRPTARRSAP
jgi:hypothetical protein